MNSIQQKSKNQGQKRWYAVYTKSRAERRVYSRLNEQDLESYLPLYKTLKQWSDRKKWVEETILKSYVFVRVCNSDFNKVLNTNGVVKFVSFEGKAAPIPDFQVRNLKLLLNDNTDFEVTCKKLKMGQKVKVASGKLQGMSGELVKIGNRKRFVVRIDQVNQNLLVNIPANYLVEDN